MRKMGWREGQGVGPRVTFDRRKDMAKELGIVLPEDEEEGDGGAAKHYYAPIDRPLTTLTEVGIASDRGWGLGYVPNPSIAQASAAGPSSRGLSSVEMDEDEVYGAGSSGFDNSNGSKKRNWVVDLEQDDGADNYTIRGTGHRRPDAVANKVSRFSQVALQDSEIRSSRSQSRRPKWRRSTTTLRSFQDSVSNGTTTPSHQRQSTLARDLPFETDSARNLDLVYPPHRLEDGSQIRNESSTLPHRRTTTKEKVDNSTPIKFVSSLLSSSQD